MKKDRSARHSRFLSPSLVKEIEAMFEVKNLERSRGRPVKVKYMDSYLRRVISTPKMPI
jgi:hypothetical protein